MQNQIKTVLITGASSGIGQATAFRFAKEKYNLILTYNKNKQGAEETKNKCKELGADEILILQLDLKNQDNIKQVVNVTLNKYSKIDILINNAAVIKMNYLKKQSLADIDEQIQTNLTGLIKLSKLFLPHLKQSLINIGSNLSTIGKSRAGVYSATKFGARGFTKSIALERKDLQVHIVNPSLTATPMVNYQGMNPKKVAEVIFNTAVGNYKSKSGSDVNVRDYRFGKFLAKIIIFLKKIKNLFL